MEQYIQSESREELEQFLSEHVLQPLTQPELYDGVYAPIRRIVVVYGRRGVGKRTVINRWRQQYEDPVASRIKVITPPSEALPADDGNIYVIICDQRPDAMLKPELRQMVGAELYLEVPTEAERLQICQRIYGDYQQHVKDKPLFAHIKFQLEEEDLLWMAQMSSGCTYQELRHVWRDLFYRMIKPAAEERLMDREELEDMILPQTGSFLPYDAEKSSSVFDAYAGRGPRRFTVSRPLSNQQPPTKRHKK